MPRSRLLLILGVSVPALLCGAVGLAHPVDLTPDTAELWRNLHLALIPIFPLMGLAPWLVARQVDRRLGWLAGLFGYGFATFYTSLDLLAGVGGGAMVMAGKTDQTGPIFEIARTLAAIGVTSLIAGAVVASIAAVIHARLAAIPGAVLAIAGALLVYSGHIYFGRGTIAMLLLAGGFTILAVVVSRPKPGAATTLPATTPTAN